jgi:citrate synthase
MSETNINPTGLRGVTIADTKISDVDGKAGKLVYRGYLVTDLAEKTTFEETVYLLLYEKLPNRTELAVLKKKLSDMSHLPEPVVNAMKTFPKDALPLDVLQSTIPMLAHHDPKIKKHLTRETALDTGIGLIARTSSLVAAWERVRKGLSPVHAAYDLSHAANFLYMLKGRKPDKNMARFFDTSLVLHAEHSFNAATFTAREVASTQAHMYAAVSAAVGSLSGELHSGADTRVMDMLKKIGTLDKVEDFVDAELKAGRKIPGMGRKLYKMDDPRAQILAPMARLMGEIAGETKWYTLAAHLEKAAKLAAKKEKDVDIFVKADYYSALLYHAMGIPVDLFTPVFAVSRVAGWVAHVLEEQFPETARKPVLYRHESEYLSTYCGPDGCLYEDIDER